MSEVLADEPEQSEPSADSLATVLGGREGGRVKLASTARQAALPVGAWRMSNAASAYVFGGDAPVDYNIGEVRKGGSAQTDFTLLHVFLVSFVDIRQERRCMRHCQRRAMRRQRH